MDRPNIVMIMADDMGAWAMGCAQNKDVITPNIDALAEDGVLFENFFCASPVCSPARASVLTGTMPSVHGVHDWIRSGSLDKQTLGEYAGHPYFASEGAPIQYLQGLITYPDLLAQNGYTCALAGKWHLGDSIHPQHGFSRWYVIGRGGCLYNQADVVENGEPIGWIETLVYHNPESLYDWFDRYVMKHMIVLKRCRDAGSSCVGTYKYCEYPGKCYDAAYISTNAVLYIFNDGTMITALTGGGVDEETGNATSMTLHVRFDTNGYGKPNTYGQDVFSFRMNINEKFAYVTCDNHKNLTGGTVSLSDGRDKLLQACKTDPQTCGCLLMNDNWEFKSDYPWL